jgi:3-phosphoshikimate 1-carboxyvinyltransferase
MGARITLPDHGGLPMTIWGGDLHDVMWQSEVASAQVKSAILLAALSGGVGAEVIEPQPTRDHTERMLIARGAPLVTHDTGVRLDELAYVEPLDVAVPGDPSSAAFFAGLAAIADGGSLRLEGVCVNETRIGFLEQLALMGASVTQVDARLEGGEPVADVIVAPGELRAATITAEDVPAMVDELPLLACLATRATGETKITGANELRVKESDRIAAVVANLRAIGADAEELPDGMIIRGPVGELRGRVTTHGDHRLAMAFGILGAAGDAIEIDDPDCVAVSYPNFWNDLASVTR